MILDLYYCYFHKTTVLILKLRLIFSSTPHFFYSLWSLKSMYATRLVPFNVKPMVETEIDWLKGIIFIAFVLFMNHNGLHLCFH